ncbi:hypothetical protein A9Q83_13605 [Alphaproteobacteria bacterium 46_93_T64]|nr:hypothetical protein A9Q83_13605 [Alphaproteobacteria bacterium 46_93_T64]
MTASLISWAETQFWQAEQVNGRGTTQAAAIRQLEKTTGVRTGRIKTERLPLCVTHIWDWFIALMPGYGLSVPNPGQWRDDIKALFGIDPRAWELQALSLLFGAWIQNQK